MQKELVSVMPLLFTAALLLCVIGGALSGEERGPRPASHQGDATFPKLTRDPRDTANNECGVRGPSYQTLIAGGKDASVGEFPWHVGIYRTVVNAPSVQDCGGTLISRTLVLSAAHCFWQDALRKLKPHSIYKIAVGKHLRAWSQKEQEAQIREVAEISVPRRYRGRNSNFQYDIAVVRMASGVDFTATVMPVCMDWSKRYEAVQLSHGVSGTVVGWGVTLDDVGSEVLQKVDLPYVDFDTCFDALPEGAKILYTDDKFCAGFANKSRSVCRGDSGGGLVFDARNRYYLRGVVSVSFKPAANRDPCYSQLYSGFTLVSQYLAWIKTFVDNERGGTGIVTQRPPKKTKSQEMCEAYSTAVYDTVDLPSSEPIKVSTCAMSPSGVTTQRLLSQPREFPHMAALGYDNSREGSVSYLCNGNLISERFVLTAAHCALNQPKWFTLSLVRLGTVSLNENSTEPGLKIVGIEQIIVHPEYNKLYPYNDVALLKLNESVSFNGFVRPACLDPSPSLLYQTTVTAASWGRVSRGYGIYENLLHGDIRIVDDDECRRIYSNQTSVKSLLPKGITSTDMLCFNSLDSSTDCSLTSGSPLMEKLTEPFCMYRIVGFVTFGQRQVCSATSLILPSVSMRISAFTPWIESVAWSTSDDADDADTINIRELPPPRQARPTLGAILFPD